MAPIKSSPMEGRGGRSKDCFSMMLQEELRSSYLLSSLICVETILYNFMMWVISDTFVPHKENIIYSCRPRQSVSAMTLVKANFSHMSGVNSALSKPGNKDAYYFHWTEDRDTILSVY